MGPSQMGLEKGTYTFFVCQLLDHSVLRRSNDCLHLHRFNSASFIMSALAYQVVNKE